MFKTDSRQRADMILVCCPGCGQEGVKIVGAPQVEASGEKALITIAMACGSSGVRFQLLIDGRAGTRMVTAEREDGPRCGGSFPRE